MHPSAIIQKRHINVLHIKFMTHVIIYSKVLVPWRRIFRLGKQIRVTTFCRHRWCQKVWPTLHPHIFSKVKLTYYSIWELSKNMRSQVQMFCDGKRFHGPPSNVQTIFAPPTLNAWKLFMPPPPHCMVMP